MSSATGPNYSIDHQIRFIVQWFRTWSELQKDDFVEILAQKLAPGSNMNGLVNGMKELDTGSRRVSLFSCQIKLFNEWWQTWSDTDKDNLTSRLKESDPKFWATVQEELSGTRKKVEDDFFLTINTLATSNGSSEKGIQEVADNANTTITTTAVAPHQVVTINGGDGLHDAADVLEDKVELQEDSNNQVINQNGIANGDDEVDDVDGTEPDGPSG